MSYSFLSKPPQYKKRPVPVTVAPVAAEAAEQLSPKNIASITLWAQAVQPGTPAPRTPPSPYRVGRRGSVTSLRRPRRASIRGCSNAAGSFLHIDTPTTISGPKNTPSVKDLTFDLTTLGYTSVFVPLPKTPVTPSLATRPSSDSKTTPSVPPTPKTPSKSKTRLTLKHFRSLGVLKPLRVGRNRSKSITSSNGPSSPTNPSSPTRSKSAAKTKKAKNLPPTLTNELLLLQFMDGGSLEKNMKRVMEKQAKKAAKQAANNNTAERDAPVVADVHRDGNGGIWRDQAEEMEYKPLLAQTEETEDDGWVQFEDEDSAAASPADTAVSSSTSQRIKMPRKRPAPLNLVAAASSSH